MEVIKMSNRLGILLAAGIFFIFASDFREKKAVVLLLLKGEILWED